MEADSPKSKLRILRMIHLALAGGLTTFGAVVLFLNMTQPMEQPESMNIMLYLPSGMFLIVILASGPIFKMLLKSAMGTNPDLSKKLAAYQSAHIVRMALFEATGLLACVVCFVTGTMQNLIWLVLVLLYFLVKMPSLFKLENELGLTREEKGQFL